MEIPPLWGSSTYFEAKVIIYVLRNETIITYYSFCIIIILRNGQEARKAEEIIFQTFKEIKVTWITQKPKQAENANVSNSSFSVWKP